MRSRLTLPVQRLLIAFFCIAILLILAVPKGNLVLAFNQTYTDFNVKAVRFINLFGDGIMFAFYVPILLFHRFKRAIYLAMVIIVQTIIVQFFKRGIADGFYRPFKYFEEQGVDLVVGEQVNINHFDSFPSGHATTSFTIGIFFMMLWKKTSYQVILFVVALCGALARVYLAQHFLIDICAGFFCAILTFMIVDFLYEKFKVYKIQGSLLSIFSPSSQIAQKQVEDKQYF